MLPSFIKKGKAIAKLENIKITRNNIDSNFKPNFNIKKFNNIRIELKELKE